LSNCSIWFYYSQSITNESGIELSQSALLSLTNSQIRTFNVFPNNTVLKDFYILGNQHSRIIFKNSSIYYNQDVVSGQFKIICQDSKDVFIDNTIFYFATNLFDLFKVKTVSITNSTFNDPQSLIIRSFNVTNLDFSGNLISSRLLFPNSTLINVNNSQNVQFFSNIFEKENNSISSTDLLDFLILFVGNRELNFTRNSFENTYNIVQFNQNNDVFISDNIFKNFSTALYHLNSDLVMISRNNFISGNLIILIDNINFNFRITCTFNNFFDIKEYLKILNDTSTKIDSNIIFVRNFYSNYTMIDFNNDGFIDKPFSSSNFIDLFPLSHSFENYYFLNNFFYLNSYYGVKKQDDYKFLNNLDFQWSFFSIIYLFIMIIPIFISYILLFSKK
jgi:hypothetical protein